MISFYFITFFMSNTLAKNDMKVTIIGLESDRKDKAYSIKSKYTSKK